MKKHILVAAASILSLTAFSQITVNRSDFATAGDWFVLATDTTIDANTATALRASGANQTWNLTGWAKRHNIDTTFYADGASYPGAPMGCNLVSFERDVNTQEEFPTFMVANNASLSVVMDMGPLSGSASTFKVFIFPSTMGTKFADSVTSFIAMPAADFGIDIPFVDSVRITYIIKNNSEIDAFGNLVLDAGTFSTLRQKTITQVNGGIKIRNTLTGTWTDIPGGGGMGEFNESTKSYTWVSANGGHPLLQVVEDTNGMVEQMDYVLASSKGLSSKLVENKALKAASKVYPVPSSEIINIEWTATQKGNASIVVYDILGNVVVPSKEYAANNGLNQIAISVNELKPGVYFYSLTGDGFERANRFVVGR